MNVNIPKFNNTDEALNYILSKEGSTSPMEALRMATTLYESQNKPEQKTIIESDTPPITISDLMLKIPKQNPFIVKGLIVEGAINLIHGDTGCGKSLFILKLVDDISTGNNFLGKFEVKKKKCLLMDLEMTEDDCIVRARNVCSQDNDSIISYEKMFRINNDKNKEWLKGLIKKENISVIVFDTLSKIHTADENSNTLMTPVMIELLNLCKEMEITVIILHHVNKTKDTTGLSKGRGASCIADNSASYLEVKSKTVITAFNKKIIDMTVTQIKNRRRESAGAFRLSINYDEDKKRTNFVYENEVKEDQSLVNRARDLVYKFVENNPGCIRSNINDGLKNDCSTRNIKDALKSLLGEEKLKEAPSGKGNSKMLYINNDEQEELDINKIKL